MLPDVRLCNGPQIFDLLAEARQEIAVGFSARDRRSQEELPSESRLHVTAIINENRFQFLANDAPFQVLELQHKVEDHTGGARIIGYEASQMPPKVRRLGDAAKVNHPLQDRKSTRQELRLFSPCPVGDRNGPFKGHARVYVGEFFVLQHGGHHQTKNALVLGKLQLAPIPITCALLAVHPKECLDKRPYILVSRDGLLCLPDGYLRLGDVVRSELAATGQELGLLDVLRHFVHLAEFLLSHDVHGAGVHRFLQHAQNKIVERYPVQDSKHFCHVAELAAYRFNLVLQDREDLGFLRALDHKVVDLGVIALAIPVDAANSLFEAIRIPGQLVVDERMAVPLEVDTFRCGIRCEEKTRIRLVETALCEEL